MTRQGVTLRERDEDILQAIYTYQYLTLNQVTRLFFSARSQHSKNHAGHYLKRLTEEDFLQRFPLPSTNKGNRAYIYMLASKGLKCIASLGYDFLPSSHQAKPPPSYQHIQHTLSLNDVLIAAALLQRSVEVVSLEAMQHEWMLKQRPLHVPIPSEAGRDIRHTESNTLTVIPDAWLDFRLHINGKTFQASVWLELDRGSEEQKQIRHKVRGLYLASLTPTNQQEFASQAQYITIAFVTTAGEKRMVQLRQWFKQELTLLQKTADADLLLVTSLSQTDELSPQRLFLAPVWFTALTDIPVPLLDLT